MYTNLAVLVLTVIVLFEEKINRMDFNLELSDWLILISLWCLMIHANRDGIKNQWKKFRRTPKILRIVERQLGLDDCDNYFRRSTSQREEQYQDILRLQNDEVSSVLI